jgi:outer membrane protein OmpA-like peptidoglycan-associated protein
MPATAGIFHKWDYIRAWFFPHSMQTQNLFFMRYLKFLIIACMLPLLFTACRSSKKSANNTSYLGRLYKDLKKELPEATVLMKGDTVRVIYPELAMFDFNKEQIKTEALPAMMRFAIVLNNYDRIHCIINGYTDNIGTDGVNRTLSEKRAENTKSFMITNAVASERMMTNGMASANPVMTNDTEEGRKANRRVEFLLYEAKTMAK